MTPDPMLPGMPAKPIHLDISGGTSLDGESYPDGLEVGDEIRIIATVVVRKTGEKHTAGGEPGDKEPFAAGQITDLTVVRP